MSPIPSLPPKVKLGAIVPPANPTVEPELYRLLPDDVGLYAARLPVNDDPSLKVRTAAYLTHYDAAIGSFGSLDIAAMFIAMTGPSYPLLRAGDRALAERLSRSAGVPVLTASLAILDALAALGVRRVALVSPYPTWLTDLALAYWKDAGIEVRQVVTMSEEFKAYELTSEETARALGQVDPAAIDAVVISGTGLVTLPAIIGARANFPRPVLSSNLCGAWALLRTIAHPQGSALFQAASPELASLLS